MRSFLKIITIIIIFYPLAGIKALERLSVIAPPIEQFSVLFPENQSSKWVEIIYGVNVYNPFSYEVSRNTNNNELSVKADSMRWSFSSEMSPAVRLKNYQISVKSPAIKNSWGCDLVDVVNDPDKKTLIAKKILSGVVKKTMSVTYDENSLENQELNMFLRALLLHGIRKSFNCDAIIGDGWKINVNLTLYETNDFQKISPSYPFPDDLKIWSNSGESFYIYEMSATGLLGIFYSYKFYSVYRKNETCDYIAAWGGDPKYCTFHIMYYGSVK